MKTFTKFKRDLAEATEVGEAEEAPKHRVVLKVGKDAETAYLSNHDHEPHARKEALKWAKSAYPGVKAKVLYTNPVKPSNEEAPTNNAGSGNIAGIGVGPHGEPGVAPIHQRKTGKLKLMNGPAVDPRMFADKIFKRKLKEDEDEHQYAYHVTPTRNVKKIMTHGLIPKIGSRSKLYGEKKPATYLFKTKDHAHDAVGNWLGDHFGEETPLSMLKVKIPHDAHHGKGADYEHVIHSPIPHHHIQLHTKEL